MRCHIDRLLLISISLVVVVLLSANAYSQPITVLFDGTITEQFGGPSEQQGFRIGDRFFGQYTFESTATANYGSYTWGGIPPERTIYADVLTSFTATSQGHTLTSAGNLQNGIIVDNNLYGNDDYFVVLASSDIELYIDLRSHNLNLFISQVLPTSLPDLSSFDNSAFFRIKTGSTSDGYSWAQGNLDSIHVTSVPEPSTLGLVLTGFFLCYTNYFIKRGTVGKNKR